MSEFTPLMSPEAYRVVMHNARSIARGHKRTPNWSFAMHLFSCGSTFGWLHCEHAEIDPDATTVGEIWRRPPSTHLSSTNLYKASTGILA